MGEATISGTLSRLIARAVRSAVRYVRVYRARVVSQADNDTLDVICDDADIGSISRVEIRGIPGVRVRVRPGAIVLLAFEAGDPTRPIATLAEIGGLASLTITADTEITIDAPTVRLRASGGRPVARVGDTFSFTAMSSSGPITGTAQVMEGAEGVLA